MHLRIMTMSMLQNNYNGISIQVGLSGYSFRLWNAGQMTSASGWLSSERIFTTPEFQRRYDNVAVSVFTPKVALVPAQFFSPERAKELLDDVVNIGVNDTVEFVEVSHLASVLVYSNAIGETLSRVISETVLKLDGSKARLLPEMYYILEQLPSLKEYNKILASYMDGVLYLVIAQGKTLLLCNSFHAPDFTTAEYFIFMAMKKLQLNPEVSTISFRTPLSEDDEMSLYRYFKSVDQI
jgi:hypothetical protein